MISVRPHLRVFVSSVLHRLSRSTSVSSLPVSPEVTIEGRLLSRCFLFAVSGSHKDPDIIRFSLVSPHAPRLPCLFAYATGACASSSHALIKLLGAWPAVLSDCSMRGGRPCRTLACRRPCPPSASPSTSPTTGAATLAP